MEYALSESEYKELVKVFNSYDKDGDGHITAEELRDSLPSLGMQKCSIEAAQKLIAKYDTNNSLTIELNEFLKAMAPKVRTQKTVASVNERELRQAFKVFDENSDGFISKDELKKVLRAQTNPTPTEEDLDSMVEDAMEDDVNGDGKLNYEEFLAMYQADEES